MKTKFYEYTQKVAVATKCRDAIYRDDLAGETEANIDEINESLHVLKAATDLIGALEGQYDFNNLQLQSIRNPSRADMLRHLTSFADSVYRAIFESDSTYTCSWCAYGHDDNHPDTWSYVEKGDAICTLCGLNDRGEDADDMRAMDDDYEDRSPDSPYEGLPRFEDYA